MYPFLNTQDILRRGLGKIPLPPEFALPLDPRIRVKRLIISKCRVMTSAKLPMWLTFENADPDGEKVVVMFKAGDDLRQDTVVLQMLRVMDAIWQQEGPSVMHFRRNIHPSFFVVHLTHPKKPFGRQCVCVCECFF